MITLSDLDNRFRYHTVNVEQGNRMADIRQKTFELAKLILENTPESREQSLAFTHLEQAMFYSNAAIARNEIEK